MYMRGFEGGLLGEKSFWLVLGRKRVRCLEVEDGTPDADASGVPRRPICSEQIVPRTVEQVIVIVVVLARGRVVTVPVVTVGVVVAGVSMILMAGGAGNQQRVAPVGQDRLERDLAGVVDDRAAEEELVVGADEEGVFQVGDSSTPGITVPDRATNRTLPSETT